MGDFFKTTFFGEFVGQPIWEMPTVHAGALDAYFYFDRNSVTLLLYSLFPRWPMANKEDNMIQISPESYKISLASKEINTLQGDGVTMGYSVSYYRSIWMIE